MSFAWTVCAAIIRVLGWAAGLWLFGMGVSCLLKRRRLRHRAGLWLIGNALWAGAIWAVVTDHDAKQVLSVILPFTGTSLTFTGDLARGSAQLLSLCGSLFLLVALMGHLIGARRRTRAIETAGVSVNAPPSPATRSSPARWRLLGASGLAMAVILFVASTRWRVSPLVGVAVLNSRAPYQAVRIPFTLPFGPFGKIYVRASLNGTPIESMVDTGTDCILIPHSMEASGAATGETVKFMGIDGPAGQDRQIVLPSLRLGGYELRQASAWVKPADTIQSGVSADTPVLGDDAFRHIVLTIDYAHRVLVLRQSRYDFTSGGDTHDGFVMDISQEADMPCVAGTLRGKPARLLLDTGLSGGSIGLTKQAGGGATPAYLHLNNINCTLSGTVGGMKRPMKIEGPGEVFPGFDKSGEGASVDLGAAFLSQFRVTIDYPRRRILLEPNADPQPNRADE